MSELENKVKKSIVVTVEDIENLHAADVVEQKHGKWMKTVGENGATSACRCSLCGFEDNRYMIFNYCPNCGALMEPYYAENEI